jgi:hypothetical protein
LLVINGFGLSFRAKTKERRARRAHLEEVIELSAKGHNTSYIADRW